MSKVKITKVNSAMMCSVKEDPDFWEPQVIAEEEIDSVTTEALLTFINKQEISDKDEYVLYTLSVDENDFNLMNKTSDVSDEWQYMDLTKISEWVDAGFSIEGVTKDGYTDLLPMAFEARDQYISAVQQPTLSADLTERIWSQMPEAIKPVYGSTKEEIVSNYYKEYSHMFK